MQPESSSPGTPLDRLLAACQRGLNHDLTNQLVALQGLLQLLEMDELDRLSQPGREYVTRLKGVGQRTMALAKTLREVVRLIHPPHKSEAFALPPLVEQVLDNARPSPLRQCKWEVQHVWAPPELVRLGFSVALPLLGELSGAPLAFVKIAAHQTGEMVECSLETNPSQERPDSSPNVQHRSMPNPGVWHEKLECVLLRESALAAHGNAHWHLEPSNPKLVLSYPMVPASPSA